MAEEPSATATTGAAIHKEKILLSKNDLVESLSQITNRERKEIQESLAKLQDLDLRKISDYAATIVDYSTIAN